MVLHTRVNIRGADADAGIMLMTGRQRSRRLHRFDAHITTPMRACTRIVEDIA